MASQTLGLLAQQIVLLLLSLVKYSSYSQDYAMDFFHQLKPFGLREFPFFHFLTTTSYPSRSLMTLPIPY